MPQYLICPKCGEHKEISAIKSEPVKTKHFLDWRITYKCKCGNEWIEGAPV